MPSGYFTQSAAILFETTPDFQAIDASLASFDIARRTPEGTEDNWMAGYPSLLVAMRPEVNGYVLVDILDRPWPDDMDDTKGEAQNTALFGAWAMGWFGPFVFPGALLRAVQQRPAIPNANEVIEKHRAIVRIKSSYVLGGSKDQPFAPDNRDCVEELRFLTSVAEAILAAPGAQCYFNPNGETLYDAATLREDIDYHDSNGLLPLPVWSNVRHFNPSLPERWMIMDTMGMEQLGVADHEACIPPDKYDLGEVVNFLRNSTAYVHANGPVIQNGDTMNGPGGINWQGWSFEESLVPRPREVLRWCPVDGSQPPAPFLPSNE